MERAPTLDDFMALNDQLAALVRAGAPLDVGLGQGADATEASLERINASVARRVSRGESLAEAVAEDERQMPEPYRNMVRVGLRSGDLGAALDGASQVAASADDSRYALQAAMLYPLIVAGLAYVGLVGFCWFYLPVLERMHAELRIPVGPGMHALQVARDWLPYWGTLPVVAVLVLGARRLFGASRGGRDGTLWKRAPGMAQAMHQQRCACFADALANLLDANVPLEDAVVLAGGASGDAVLEAGAQKLSTALKQDIAAADETDAAGSFPPFLRWALLRSETVTDRPRALRMAADVYRTASERRRERVRLLAPMAAVALVGGVATLLYGLALFVPVVELLRSLAA